MEKHKDQTFNIQNRNTSSVLDDIIHRISSLSIPINFESYFKLIQDSDFLVKELNNNDPTNSYLKKEDLPFARNNWTVAPKLFVTNNNVCLTPTSTSRLETNAQYSTVFSFEKSTKYTLISFLPLTILQ